MLLNRSDLRLKGLMVLILVAVGAALFAVREGRLKISASRAQVEKRPLLEAAPSSKAEPQTSPGAAPALPPASGGASNARPTAESFREIAERTLRELPQRSDLKGLSAEEIHETPPPMRAAAIQLGRIGDLLQENPSLKAQGLEFYRKCSLDARGLTPVRALCLNRALRLYAELHHALWDFDGQKIPKRVLSLAKRL